MGNELTAGDVAEMARRRWSGRDQLVIVCAADYTDLAVGLGETKLFISVFACSSANVARANEKASRMGHEAAGMEVDGSLGEELGRMLGLAGNSWSRRAGWPYRYLTLSGAKLPEGEAGLMYSKGELGRRRADTDADARSIKKIFDMYGVESSEPSKPMIAMADSADLENPLRHPSFWSWIGACIRQS